MKLKIFSVYDDKVAAYMQPFFMSTKGQAIRALQDTLSDEKHQFAKHPHDFSLWCIGEFDDQNSEIIATEKSCLGTVTELSNLNKE